MSEPCYVGVGGVSANFNVANFCDNISPIHLFTIKMGKLEIGLLACETFRISIYVGPLMMEVF